MKVYKTYDYSKFKYVGGNRNVNPTHVKHLIESMSAEDLSETMPIIVNERLEIIDGQHRFDGRKQMGLPIYYTIRDGARLNEVVLLNANTRNWSLTDYLNSHIARGNKQYEIVKNFMDFYGISGSMALELLNTKYNKRGKMIDEFKNGAYEVTNLAGAKEFADELIKYKPFLAKGTFRSREFIRAMRKLHDDDMIDHDKMRRKLDILGEKLATAADLKAMLRQLEEVYNYHSREQIRFF